MEEDVEGDTEIKRNAETVGVSLEIPAPILFLSLNRPISMF